MNGVSLQCHAPGLTRHVSLGVPVPTLSLPIGVLGKDFYQSPRKVCVHKTSTQPKSKAFPSSSSQTVGVPYISCLGERKPLPGTFQKGLVL